MRAKPKMIKVSSPAKEQQEYYRGVRMVNYDLIKEVVVAFLIIGFIVVVCSFLFSSPDLKPVTIQEYAAKMPVDFLQTALSELDGSSTTGTYGPPYNNGTGSVQSLGFFAPQEWAGVHQPVNSADLVLEPLKKEATPGSPLALALSRWFSASSRQQAIWEKNFGKALNKATFANGRFTIRPGNYGPLKEMMLAYYQAGITGGLDALLSASNHIYQVNYTKPLLFLNDGSYLPEVVGKQHLLPNQWGMMNETGGWPGQAWLWLYTFWYQIPPFNTSSSADLMVFLIMIVLSAGLAAFPYLPVINKIPEWIPLHRFIWRNYYKEHNLM